MSASQPKPSRKVADFPSAKGQTLKGLRLKLPSGPILAPSTTQSLAVGDNRFGFALRDRANKTIAGVPAALYVFDHNGTHGRGPYLTRAESLAVKPPFQSKTTSQDPDAATSLYVADIPIKSPGRHIVTGVARLDGRLVATTGIEVPFPARGSKTGPPDVGDQAVRVHTLTLSDVGGDASKIETRVPPDLAMLKTDLADVLGKKPAVYILATPLLCQSRVCGPVVDIAAQVQSQFAGRVAFVRQEIYKDNEVNKGLRPQVDAWRLQTEPWTYVIDRSGKISARFEGAMSTDELTRAVAKVAG